MSPECRLELQHYARQATNLGKKELILPLHYIDVPAINNPTATDDLIGLVRTFQWEDWRDLRFLDIASEGYRRGVARLASRLVEANRHIEEMATANVPQTAEETLNVDIDDSLGYIDRLANAEEALPKMQANLEAMKQVIELIGQIMVEATKDTQQGNAQGKGFAARLIVVRRIVSQMDEPTKQILSLSNEFASLLHYVDEGFRVIIEHAPVEIKDNPGSNANFCVYFKAVRALSKASHIALGKFQLMINSIESLERMSRDLRPVLRRLRQGLTIMVESRGISDEWIHLIETSDVICEGTDAQVIQSTS
jgi:hypothetical protein